MLVPRSHGGAELALPAQMRVLEELARADGSVGWTVMIGGEAPVLLGKPRARPSTPSTAGPDVILAGTIKPSGVATPVDGGFRPPDSGRSPAAACTPTGSSPTASWTTADSRRSA